MKPQERPDPYPQTTIFAVPFATFKLITFETEITSIINGTRKSQCLATSTTERDRRSIPQHLVIESTASRQQSDLEARNVPPLHLL